MSRPSNIDMLSDLEALEVIEGGRSVGKDKCSRRFRSMSLSGQDALRGARYVSDRVTLPRLKFLEGKD